MKYVSNNLSVYLRILLSLDDKEIGTTRLARGTKDIDAPTQGGLFLGGLRKSFGLFIYLDQDIN